jgi:Tol biopolymer transport system component
MNRIRRRASILAIAILTTLPILVLAPGVGATFPARNGLIAFHVEGGDDGPQIFTVRSNGKQLRQVTTAVDGVAALPDWSPDGRQIVFTRNECTIAMIDADGGNLHEVASHEGACLGDANFTPDGARLVFTRFDFAIEVESIWSMKVDGSDQQFITDRGGPDPNVSPDGRKISFKGGPDGALFVANIDGTGVVQVSPSISVTYKHDWAPDGKHIVVSDNSHPTPDESANVVTVRPDGSDWTYLTNYAAGFRASAGGYSPDGQWIVFRLEGPGLVPTLYRIRPDGSDLHALYASSTIIPRFIDWGPAPTN